MASGVTARPVNLVAYRRLSEATSAKLSLRVEEAYLQVTAPARARQLGSHGPCILSSSRPLYPHIDHLVLASSPWITCPLYPHQLTSSLLSLYQSSVSHSLSRLRSHFSPLLPPPSSLLPPPSSILSPLYIHEPLFITLLSPISSLYPSLSAPLCMPVNVSRRLVVANSLSLSLMWQMRGSVSRRLAEATMATVQVSVSVEKRSAWKERSVGRRGRYGEEVAWNERGREPPLPA